MKSDKKESTPENTENVCSVSKDEVEKTIRKTVYVSMGIGIVPFPLFNFGAVTATNLVLIQKLSNFYGVEFKEGVAKKIIASVGGAGLGTLATPLVESVVALTPIIGLPLAIGTKPVLNAMTTYALAQMFVTHFERGGSFIGANMEAMKSDFSTAFKKSREWLGNTIKGKEKTPETAEA